MRFIEFNEDRCDACFKCLRVCPTKAISFNTDTRSIIDDLCIKCGLCQQSCDREALKITNAVDQVLALIAEGEQVAVSLAPSYVGAFGLHNPNKIVGALKNFGIAMVEETAIGAELVAQEYDRYINEGTQNVYITSCCPSANYLIEQHYPSAIPSVIPVVSPMIAHGRSIKKRYGDKIKVVFIGPCMAKMAEAEEMDGAIDYVLTFDELNQILRAEEKTIYDYEAMPFDNISRPRGRSFPMGGSLRQSVVDKKGYHRLQVDGIEGCKKVLSDIKNGFITDCCVEINICEGSCMNGPDMPKNHLSRFSRTLFMHEYIEKAKLEKDNLLNQETSSTVDDDQDINGDEDTRPVMYREFRDKQPSEQEPNVATIRQIMAQMGKYSKEDELNCGACGYKTCYNKAKAVFKGYSDVETCLPYLRDKAESMQNVMIENSPNAVLLIDSELNIKEVNPSFNRILNQNNLPYEGIPMKFFVDHPIFDEAIEKKEPIQNKKIYVIGMETYFLVNIVYLESRNMLLVFMTDITVEEENKKEFIRVKEETLHKTQEVIDNQMRVAQEIASLLGETTAETKMSLKSLNELVMYDWEVPDEV